MKAYIGQMTEQFLLVAWLKPDHTDNNKRTPFCCSGVTGGCPSGWVAWSGRCYLLQPTSVEQSAAVALCGLYNATLVSVNSQQELVSRILFSGFLFCFCFSLHNEYQRRQARIRGQYWNAEEDVSPKMQRSEAVEQLLTKVSLCLLLLLLLLMIKMMRDA